MLRIPSRILRPAFVVLVCALTACASQADKEQAELTELSLVLPGVYSNPEQVLLVLNVFVPMMGGTMFYVRESAANDPRRVYSERMWNLDTSSSGHPVAMVYAFDQPDRWHDGAENPELFRAMLQQDLRPLPGCELIWEKTERGYHATSASPRCPQSWKLEGEQLSFSDKPVNLSPGAPDSYFHFTRAAQ
jgi:CpeT/CpcT family (DUF1001)